MSVGPPAYGFGGIVALPDTAIGNAVPPPNAEASLQQLIVTAANNPRTPTKTSAEQLLHKAEVRYRALVEQIPAITFIASLDESDNEMYVSPQIERILGYSQEEWLNDPILWYTRLHPDDRERWNVEFAQTCASSQPFRSEYRFISREGKIVWVLGEARVVRDEEGRPLFLQGVAFDITEQKRAEQILLRRGQDLEEQVQRRTAELSTAVQSLKNHISERQRAEEMIRDREARLRSVFETAVDAIIVIDDAAIVETMNPAAEKLFGYKSEEVLGRNISMLMPSPYRENHDEYLAHYLKTGIKKVIGMGREVVGRRKDGSTMPIELAVSEMRIGNTRRFTGMVRDISDRKRVEQELREARLTAEAASAAKSRFVANMSHEIRTPLNAILGFTDLLRRGADEGNEEERNEWLQTIQSAGRHLLEVINEILDISKLESGKLEIERIASEPVAIINDITSILRPRAAEKGLRLEIEYVGDIPTKINTDPTRLRQLLINLIGNAIKFTEAGGIRMITALHRGEEGTRLCIEIADTGIGIPDDKLQTIFDPFVQADASTTRRYGGTGLGLAISKHIAKALGGDLTVTSVLGQGTIFTCEIDTGPLDNIEMFADPLAEAVMTKKPPLSETPRLVGRILVVDDGGTNRKLMKLILSRAGAAVETAENGKIAVDMVMQQSYDMILMDMQMPIMDGYTATRTLREKNVQVPIIALTANAMKEDRERCLAAGCSNYLSKPIDPERLLRAVADVMHSGIDVETESIKPLQKREPIVLKSTLPTEDPDFREVVEEFAERLKHQLEEFETALKEKDFATLKNLAHWLKGAGGTAGFSAFTAPAAQLEVLASEEDLESIGRSIFGLIELSNQIVVDAGPGQESNVEGH